MIRIISLLCLVMCLLPSFAFAQQPPMSFEKRIELAKKLIAEDRAGAIAAPSDPVRASLFTEVNALIEPQWTADFILNNPIKGQEGMDYENTAITNLLSHPEALTEQQVLDLVDYYPFLSGNFIRIALESLPNDSKHDALKKKLVQKAIDRLDNQNPMEIAFGIFSPTSNAHLSSSRELAKRTKAKTEEFFVSGAVEKLWKSIPEDQWTAYHIVRLKRKAPAGFDLSFLGELGPDSITQGFELSQVLSDPSLSKKEKVSWLAAKDKVAFGTEVYEAKSSALKLGLVAEFDLDKALAWSETGKSPVVEILAKLSIAPVLAKTDKEAAIELVRQCYNNCAHLDPVAPANRGDSILLNTAPHQIATTGLKIANHIDAELLKECVKTTLEMIKTEMESTKKFLNPGVVYRALAAVSRYDREGAKTLLDNISEVQLGYASEFFVALVAITPETVWEEYSTLPPETDDIFSPRLLSRQAIATALVQRDEDEFWAKLERYYYLEFPESIFTR